MGGTTTHSRWLSFRYVLAERERCGSAILRLRGLEQHKGPIGLAWWWLKFPAARVPGKSNLRKCWVDQLPAIAKLGQKMGGNHVVSAGGRNFSIFLIFRMPVAQTMLRCPRILAVLVGHACCL